jgi:ABC-type Fe3+ transport system permease subunit
MTIREYIKRRMRWTLVVVIVCSLLASATGIIGLLGTVGVLGAVLSLLFIRCPKCRRDIGTITGIPAAFYFFGHSVKTCPRCGVSLDEPVESTATRL